MSFTVQLSQTQDGEAGGRLQLLTFAHNKDELEALYPGFRLSGDTGRLKLMELLKDVCTHDSEL